MARLRQRQAGIVTVARSWSKGALPHLTDPEDVLRLTPVAAAFA
jgi:hypothetical protein